ncbi:LacI family transcriptional regulator [Mesorhizobium sp. BR1-1-16]|uniref:LacI family DNA-binding transcriptional regulator n=1 Tax=Mesorhizobium sp. BR1-1-16 TaxID=2876653 RepID=UPI001CC96302|nr:LacI family DNA-binding transcriptional regulator [Mesorhizobium sp. BR1-1-16]MBZ9939406.1 LacI family transcriptional regulator [Mesorhizobium sp. BR1-1-16]
MSKEPTRRRATIKDVAKAADVSAMTVSNVLNERLQFVSPATKKRVEREIERLGYRRQANARNLRVAEQRSIGMVIVDESPAFLADFFTCQVVAGLANVLNGADFTLTVQGMHGDQLSSSMIMRNFEVAGFCAMISGHDADRHAAIRQLVNLDQPLIVFQEPIALPGADFCTIRQDDCGGGRLIGDHLLARRVEDFLAIVPSQDWPAIEMRVKGLRESLAANGGAARLTVITAASESFADVQEAVARYLAANPLPGAIVGANDPIATAAMLYLFDHGIRVPDEVRIVGFNGFEAHRYARPRLTTVDSPAYALGEQAGKAMLSRLESGRFERPEFVLPVHFDPGATT